MTTPPHALPAPDNGAPIAEEPEITFDSFGLHPDLLRGIHDLGFIRPTPIQAQAIPHVLAGRDVIGCAQTGTGKTAAFVLPILHRLLQVPSHGRGRVRSLIIAPTRELALQSMEHLRSLSRYVPLKGAAIFGGVPMEPQIRALEQGLDIVSATPGRLLDHIYSGRIDFADLSVFVLDEADRMLDMGFLPDIHKILRLLPPKRQNLLFSATMLPEIITLAHEFLHDPVTVQVGRRSSPATGVRHAIFVVPRHLKTELLLQLLRRDGMTSVLVFTRTKSYASRLSDTLLQKGVKVSVLHGDRSQSQRLRALDQFRRGRSQVMVATDIAARGLDIDDISHVINFDLPNTPEDYVHRIGRTARADATGDALTLVDPQDEPLVREIEQALKISLPRETLPGFDYAKGGAQRSQPHDHRHGPPRHRPSGHRPPGHASGGHGHSSGGQGHHGRRRR
jgi:ATP-dependent RNA helicase RhlE